MFCPESIILNSDYFILTHHGIRDVRWEYRSKSERYNPLRYELGIRFNKNRGPRFKINEDAHLHRKFSNLRYKLKTFMNQGINS